MRDEKRILSISRKAKYTPLIGHVVSMMEHARDATLYQIRDLTEEQLDYVLFDNSNSIGALLRHICAMEVLHTIVLFENRDMNLEERKFWKYSLPGSMLEERVKGHDIGYYLNLLTNTRSTTLEKLKQYDDSWLYQESVFYPSVKAKPLFFDYST